MKFTFAGIDYRIIFRHDKSRLVADHIGHTVRIVRVPDHYQDEGRMVNGLRLPRKPVGQFNVRLICDSCRVMIGDIPKVDRVRKTHCVIQRKIVAGRDESPWESYISGTGTPNLSAGDTFNKKEGRLAALVNALNARVAGVADSRTDLFNTLALEAYNNRKLAVKHA